MSARTLQNNVRTTNLWLTRQGCLLPVCEPVKMLEGVFLFNKNFSILKIWQSCHSFGQVASFGEMSEGMSGIIAFDDISFRNVRSKPLTSLWLIRHRSVSQRFAPHQGSVSQVSDVKCLVRANYFLFFWILILNWYYINNNIEG